MASSSSDESPGEHRDPALLIEEVKERLELADRTLLDRLGNEAAGQPGNEAVDQLASGAEYEPMPELQQALAELEQGLEAVAKHAPRQIAAESESSLAAAAATAAAAHLVEMLQVGGTYAGSSGSAMAGAGTEEHLLEDMLAEQRQKEATAQLLDFDQVLSLVEDSQSSLQEQLRESLHRLPAIPLENQAESLAPGQLAPDVEDDSPIMGLTRELDGGDDAHSAWMQLELLGATGEGPPLPAFALGTTRSMVATGILPEKQVRGQTPPVAATYTWFTGLRSYAPLPSPPRKLAATPARPTSGPASGTPLSAAMPGAPAIMAAAAGSPFKLRHTAPHPAPNSFKGIWRNTSAAYDKAHLYLSSSIGPMAGIRNDKLNLREDVGLDAKPAFKTYFPRAAVAKDFVKFFPQGPSGFINLWPRHRQDPIIPSDKGPMTFMPRTKTNLRRDDQNALRSPPFVARIPKRSPFIKTDPSGVIPGWQRQPV